jgi:hypothetical protein
MEADHNVEALPPLALREAIDALWEIRPPGLRNMFSAPEFAHLRDVCVQLYPKVCPKSNAEDALVGLELALAEALKGLGLPGRPHPADRMLALPASIAATRLHAAFQQSQTERVYLCPLDKAGEIPELSFGPNRIGRVTPAELEKVIDLPRLKRISPTWDFDADRFSEFTWLIVDRVFPTAETPAERWQPGLLGGFTIFDRKRMGIAPHRGRFSAAIENALFALLLAPWEDWTFFAHFGNWRCFEVPWVYEVEHDLFVESDPPPSPKSLSWERPDDEEDEDRPERIELQLGGSQISDWVNEERWADLSQALQTPLFDAPIVHFFEKAFLEDPLDEFLAHLITIEAALGDANDTAGKKTASIANRISRLTGKVQEGHIYKDLYKLRSAFLHGQKMNAIPAESRVMARGLARRVVQRLIEAAVKDPRPDSREYYLRGLSW